MKIHVAVALVGMAGAVSLSCTDPILEQIVANQGKETSGVPIGEFHRPGQSCTACHQEHGVASNSPFTLAGTVFAQPLRQVGVDGVEIRLTDADGTKHTAHTNCVGNFFLKASDWQPKFPILVEIAKNNVRRSMRSPIGRATDCGACHSIMNPPLDPLSEMPQIYLFAADELGAPNGSSQCPVDPVRPGSQ